MTLRYRVPFSFVALLMACETESSEPPLFNARDLSLQCPTGQVGWDFSTGGNDSAVVEASVSREITIDNAMLGTCNYKADFAMDCDGKRDCTRLVKKSTSPACAGGLFNLTYRCGDEPHRYNVILPSDASGRTINLACNEPLTITSAVYGSNAPSAANQAVITTAVASACTGKRRCSIDDPFVLNGRNDPWPNNNKDTLIKYFCGNDPVLKESIVPAGSRVDIQCPAAAASVPAFNDTMRILGVRVANDALAQDYGAQTKAAEWETLMKAGCDGKRYCRFPLPKRLSTESSILLRADFYCSSPQAPESRVFSSNNFYEPFVEVYCGLPIRITGATGNGANLATARAQCDYKSHCVLPPLTTDGGREYATARYEYTCGENVFDVRQSPLQEGEPSKVVGPPWRTPVAAPMDRRISCDRASNKLVGGIRVISATLNGQDGLLQATNACFGRDLCTIQASGSVTYRCGSSYLPKSVSSAGSLVLSCIPDVNVVSLECDNSTGPLSSLLPPLGTRCLDSAQTGRRELTVDDAKSSCRPGNNGTCGINKAAEQIAILKWRCGSDPTLYTYVGRGEPYTNQFGVTLFDILKPTCEVTAVPYVEKACVPEFCPGGMKRDSKLNCIPDATLTRAEVFSEPVIKTWVPGPDGGTSQFGGPETATLVEDFPYQVFGFSQYKTNNGTLLAPNLGVTLFAYDQFEANPGSGVPENQKTTFGFRCVVARAQLRDADVPSPWLPGYRLVINGGKGGVLPISCFRQDVDDGRNAWSDGARRVGIPESQFRARYARKTSWVASSFDAEGRFHTRLFNGVPIRAVNPIGFFYNSNNGWIDQLSFYLQHADLRLAKQVTFVESTEIQLDATSARLREGVIKLDVAKPDALPVVDVDLTWSLRGDSPAKNPLSPRSILTPSAATPLSKRNLRATIEMAYLSQQDGGVKTEPEWVAVNAISFPEKSLGPGNAMSATQRLTAEITPAVRNRLLSVKGTNANELQTADGLMRSFEEDKTVLRVRVCMDFDGVTHALGTTELPSSSLANVGVKATSGNVNYGLTFKNRCVETAPLLVERELFVYPTTPYVTVEAPANSASSPRQGDGAAGSTNDIGNQSSCTETTTGKQTCAGQSRNSMVTSGQFSLSAFDTGSEDTTSQEEMVKTTKLSSNMTVFGFKVFDLSRGGMAEPQSPGAWQAKIDLSPNLQAIMDAWKSRRAAGVKTQATNQKMKPKEKKKKGALSAFASKFERDGLALKLGKEFPFTLGPFPFVLDVSFSVGFGFGASVTLAGDRQSTTSMVNPKYPCLKAGQDDCFVAYPEMGTTVKTFEDALQDCRFRGGKLAEVRTASDLTGVATATASVGTASSALWLGGQSAYQYADPRCDQSRDPRCAGTSRTRWAWLTGNVGFANHLRQGPAVFDNANHGFGSSGAGPLATFVPDRAAVLYKKDTGRLVSARVTETAAWVCQFEPASSYIEASVGVEVKAEFSAGFQAKICTPSADIGFCLGVGVNLITAGVNVSAERSRILIFNNSREKVGLLGESKVAGAWEVAFMSGSFSAELNFLFYSTSWEIASYEGLFKLEGDLFPEIVSPYARTFP